MTSPRRPWSVLKTLPETLQKGVHYLAQGIERIFKPITDQFPAAGPQPYQEETDKRKRRGKRPSW
ncbi:MAG: hypothetical protein HC921_08310 [Synechococcaceae cyanobacterium SM2_3_1]|nr:hypothetical protein [Synechococcaceae cyanobacterium SM2_3_1]